MILGVLPTPPAVVSAETIRALRAPEGDRPCADGLRAALRWIGDRALPFEVAIVEAREKVGAEFFEWGMRALGFGYGFGDGDGDGFGYGFGYGDGYGFGYGYGYGDGDGSGDGSGDGYGYGYGEPEDADEDEDEDEEEEEGDE